MKCRAVALSLLWFCLIGLVFVSPAGAWGQSVYLERPVDPLAVEARPGAFGLRGDGVADDADGLQAAINHVQETTGEGIVFLREGRYRLSHTVTLWSGIRLIGYGARRPVLVLGARTPGYQEGHEFLGTGRYMLQFASRRPAAGAPVVDANEFTFYSAVSNVDFEIGPGNPAAIAIRFHVAQHSFLSHMDIRVGEGRAGLEDVGNQAHDLTIEGGEYGILSKRTAPAWQFLLMDARLSGQRVAAIHTEEVGMTLVRVEMAHTPVAVEVSAGMPEQLYGRDLLLRDITHAAVVLGDVSQQHNQVTLENVRCENVQQLLERGELAAGWNPILSRGHAFVEQELTLGQEIGSDGREGQIALRHREDVLAGEPTMPATDVPALPPVAAWVNVKTLGVKGDGGTDDTAALQRAVEAHRVLYLPSGVYRLRGTVHLRADTVLIGLNPATTLVTEWEKDPNFMGQGDAVPLLDTPASGQTVVTGFAIATGDVAPRAAGLVWRAGPRGMVDDVNFARGRSRLTSLLAPAYPRAAAESASEVEAAKGTQYPSLWVRDGGGGVLRDVWTANTMARAGWRVEGTSTPGVAYQVSCEHHPLHEVQFAKAAHWRVYALQTEEENPDGAKATPVELDGAEDITFANLFNYRVSRNVEPMPAALVSEGSSGVRLENMHNFSQTRLAFDNSVIDRTSGVAVRTHDFTRFEIGPALHRGAPLPMPAVFVAGAALTKIADGYSNATGLAGGPGGDVFFTDAVRHGVYRWEAATNRVMALTETLPSPQSVAFVAPATLMVMDNSKHVYRMGADGAGGAQGVAQLVTARAEAADTTLLLPVGLHESLRTLDWLVAGRGYVYAPHSNMAVTGMNEREPRTFYYAPGTAVAMEGAGAPGPVSIAGPAGAASSVGTWKPDLQAMQWAAFTVGAGHLVASEEDDKVYRARLTAPDRLDARVFLPRSGTSVVEDAAGNVYVAGAQVFVYDRTGRLSGTLEMPERPSSLAFGGPDKKRLLIGARSGLYAIQTEASGR